MFEKLGQNREVFLLFSGCAILQYFTVYAAYSLHCFSLGSQIQHSP